MRSWLAGGKGVALSWEDAERRWGGVVGVGVDGGGRAGGEAGGGVPCRDDDASISSYEPGAGLAG